MLFSKITFLGNEDVIQFLANRREHLVVVETDVRAKKGELAANRFEEAGWATIRADAEISKPKIRPGYYCMTDLRTTHNTLVPCCRCMHPGE